MSLKMSLKSVLSFPYLFIKIRRNWKLVGDEKLKEEHESVPKNPLIADHFFLTRLIEK